MCCVLPVNSRISALHSLAQNQENWIIRWICMPQDGLRGEIGLFLGLPALPDFGVCSCVCERGVKKSQVFFY